MKVALSIARTLAALSVAGAAVSAYAINDHRFLLINRADQTVVEFHATHVGDPFGPDLLGATTLPSGYQVLIDADDGVPGDCFFNFTTVMDDGQVAYKRNVDVCEILRYTISSR